MNEPKPAKSPHAEREERILNVWKEKGAFEKSLKREAPKGDYTFYDGPPFATGTPHYGHILAGTIKDVIPRWKTMQGYRVGRRWGWDCHGLPVENLVEKELGLKSKKDIVDYGIGKFNNAARESVMRYADEWRRIVPRLGRWVDMENDYRTMDASYTESVWWIFKQLHEKGLIYEGFKSMNLCPHCETTLSNFEVAQGYKDITDISVYVKFKIKYQISNIKNGSEEDYLLAWTTTPWTLPGNVALAVNPKIDYVKIKMADAGPNQEKSGLFILAKDRLSILKGAKYEVLEIIHGSKLVGLSYEPLFDYYFKDASLMNRENGWKVYGADFVTTEDGTGIVHIAPAFGADDYDLLLKHHLPFVQHVSTDGIFKKEVVDFAGMSVKAKDTDEDKNAHQKGDIEVIKWLAHRGFLFEKEKIIHSYPHCWRCGTPLLNYAASSWFVKVTDIKGKLVSENEKVSWVPPEVGSARFGNWLEGARDWAISRSRFWGAPIPVWREEGDGKRVHVIGSVEDVKKFSKSKNTYYVIRHGEAENNAGGFLSGKPEAPHHLTPKGREQVAKSAEELRQVRVDLIAASPFVRTRETLEVIKEKLGWDKVEVVTDKRLGELDAGTWNGRKAQEFFTSYPFAGRFTSMPEGGETYGAIKKRMGDFLYDMEKKHEGKTILIVSHETSIFLLFAAAAGLDRKQTLALRGGESDFISNAEVRKLDFSPLPHNEEYELDLHRPYIDDLELKTSDGRRLIRVTDVFDCWFESGAMPYGKAHYPFESQEVRGKSLEVRETRHEEFDPQSHIFGKSKGFPADFIAEGLDQTRGWFYSMLVLGVAFFGRSPYKKVIVNGLVLAEDGEKMSKSKKNYPDPMLIVDKYGADSLRFYMLSSPVVRGQDLCFSEKGVDEVTKKLVNRLLNVVSFYEMYVESGEVRDKSLEIRGSREAPPASSHVLDKWAINRLNQTIEIVTEGLEKGELDRASRPFMDFVDDLSVWYIRRSRDRFKNEDDADRQAALLTTRHLLLELSKLLAPFMPFLAEEIYQKVGGKLESVHLEDWPVGAKYDTAVLEAMNVVRRIASQGLEARMTAKINVRQPLQTLRVKNDGQNIKNDAGLITLIKDEVNVKEVAFAASIEKETELDLVISPELKEEGEIRELVRRIQDMRKEKGLSVGDKAILTAPVHLKDLITRNEPTLKKATGVDEIKYGEKLEIIPEK